MDKTDIPKDQWTQIPDAQLAKKGLTQYVYVPSNYLGPIAIDAKVEVEWGGSLRCITSDGRNVNIADELNRLERKK